MNIESLREYLLVFSKEGYAKDPGTKNPDGSMTIRHVSENKEWSTIDTYWGGEPYGGTEVVSNKGIPCWLMTYYGAVKKGVINIEEVYGFLRYALSNTDEAFPLRGPASIENGDMTYFNDWHGGIEKFDGKERILKSGEEIYAASYMGGLVNQRGE